jgi:hypothetical protein
MAIVMEKVSPKEHADEGGVHFHIYRPEISNINNYETIEVGSNLKDEKDELAST